MPIHNLTGYSDNYSKHQEVYDNIIDMNNQKPKIKITEKTPTAGNVKDVKILVPLIYLSNFWRTLEMPLINCKINLILTWSENFVISSVTGTERFATTETKLYVPVVILSSKGNIKLSFRLYNKKDHWFESLSKEENEAFINSKHDKNIIIQKDDKGNSVLIIYGMSYIAKMEELLSDRSKFVKVEFNSKYKLNHESRHLLDMEKEIKSCLDDLQNSNYLSEDNYKFMKPCGSKPGVMYGLCKVHKGITPNDSVPPFRPILSAIGTCICNLAKFFVPLPKQYTINECTVEDYFLARKLLIKTLSCLWHLLTFSCCLLIVH